MRKQIYSNKVKTAFIITLIASILGGVIYFITYSLGYGRYAVVISVGITILTSLYSYWNSSKLVLKINKAYLCIVISYDNTGILETDIRNK